MDDAFRCVKCGMLNAAPIVDYCSMCGEKGTHSKDDRRASVGPKKTLQFNDKQGDRVAAVSLSAAGAQQTTLEEDSKHLLAFVKSFVDDAPESIDGYTDGIAICKLIGAVSSTNPRYNPKPKMVLQKLNNVHLAVTTMESLGIMTAGINTKDVVDGNEKMILNILRCLEAFARRTKTRRQSIGGVASAKEALSPSSAVLAGPELAAAISDSQSPEKNGSSGLKSPVTSAISSAPVTPSTVTSVSPRTPATAATPMTPASATVNMTSPQPSQPKSKQQSTAPDNNDGDTEELERLKRESRQQEAELRALDDKIKAMNDRLQTLNTPAPPTTAATPVVKAPRIAVTDLSSSNVPKVEPKVEAAPAPTATAAKAAPTSPRPVSPGNVGRVIVLDSKPPPRAVDQERAIDIESSTEGEDDSDEKVAEKPKQISDDREAAMERLRQWKLEEEARKRKEAEEKAAAELAKVKDTGVAPEETTPTMRRSKKGGRRRKKRVGSKKSAPSTPSAAAAANSDDEDSGISDSPDNSDDESAATTPSHGVSKSGSVSPAPSGSPVPPPLNRTSTPPVPPKSDLVTDKAKMQQKMRQRKKRDQARADRTNQLEADLDALTKERAETAALESPVVKAEEDVADLAAHVAADLANISTAAIAAHQAAKASPSVEDLKKKRWLVPQPRQDELQKLFGSNKAFLKGLARLQAVVRMRNAKRKRKMLQKRSFIAREVVESERSYVRNLGICIDHFYKPMTELSYINDIQIRSMFSEISVIKGYNAHLCGQLEQRHSNWNASGQRFGDIFLSFVAYFRTYTSYVNNYNDAMAVFYNLQAKNKAFQAFLAEKKMDPALNGQELPAFLIMPIQRLPRYVMLLEDLLKNTPRDHADYGDLSTALAKVQEVADYVNEKKREAENINQVIDVQSRLTGMSKNLAEPHRRFVRQGAVQNIDGKGELMLFLFNDILVMGKESHGLAKMAEKGKEMLGISKKGGGGSTPKLNRKAHASPFFGKKKPQLQAVEDDREYKYVKTIHLADCKINALFGSAAAASSNEMAAARKNSATALIPGAMFTIKTPLDTFHFGTATEEDTVSWLQDLDTTVMRLVERKRLRAERTLKHHDGSDQLFLTPQGGRHVVNKADASYSGRVMLRDGDGKYTWKNMSLVKPHLYVFEENEEAEPSGWLFLLTSHVVFGTASTDPFGWKFALHVPHCDLPTANPWLQRMSTRVAGHSGNGDKGVSDKDLLTEEDQDRDVYEFICPNVNDVLSWCREVRNMILDAVKLPDDLCPLEQIQKGNDTEENNSCADCGFVPTKYASINLGVFLCAACAELHHELLDGVSVIRDIKEPWDITAQQRFELEALMGNAKRNKIFEKNALKKDAQKARPNDSRDLRTKWIKAKYSLTAAEAPSSSLTPGVRRLSSMGDTAMASPAPKKLPNK